MARNLAKTSLISHKLLTHINAIICKHIIVIIGYRSHYVSRINPYIQETKNETSHGPRGLAIP